ncbi:MAG TPA: 2-isopropylmalate synthase [Miltoncostaeaceae bacterium]|nr:2-isopropylmalate synthase [Miltoncostaeaceae bacterium]
MSQDAIARDPDKRIKFFDTTLRDGEQSPGIHLNMREKLEIAGQLARLGVDVIEAGFPISSPGDFEGVQAIAREVQGPVIAGLARANDRDITTCWEAVRDAERPRIHTFIATSDIHLRYKLRMDRPEVRAAALDAVRLARSLCDDVEFSCEDATRSDVAFVAEVVAGAIAEGATTINIPDTVGYTMPNEFQRFLLEIYERCPPLADVTVSVHCHNDLGLAVANSLAGLHVGARQVECCVNGIGERAGNASLEELAMILRTRGEDVGGMWCGIQTPEITRASRLVSRLTGYLIQPNKAVVGRNAFAHEAGIHQHGVLQNPLTYEIMDATSVGLAKSELVLGKHSGRHALKHALEELGYRLDRDELDAVFARFKEVADRKGELTALDLDALMGDEVRVEAEDGYVLSGFGLTIDQEGPPTARVSVAGPDGLRRDAEASGDGPVDAVMKAIDAAIGSAGILLEYMVSAVTGGKDALGEARVVCEIDGRIYTGIGVSTDVLEASAIAYIRAVNASRRADLDARVAEGV